MGVSAMLGGAGGHVNASKMRLKCVSPTQHSISHRSMKKKNPQFQFYFNYYWVRLKGFMWLRDFLPIFQKIAVRQSVGGCGAAEKIQNHASLLVQLSILLFHTRNFQRKPQKGSVRKPKVML